MKSDMHKPDGSGVVQGDTQAMPDRGTGTGMNGDSYGANLSPDATNGMGSMGSATKSDSETMKNGRN